MDDFNIGNLQESKNEWCVRLLNILTPPIRDGIKSIFISARKLCIDNKEPGKYLLTFQNLLTRVPQWNPEIISTEVSRILKSSNCTYLEDLITCVHIIQLKLLTYARVGVKYKKLDLTIPKLNDFVHKVYINSARLFYQQAFLFKQDISPIDVQKNNVIINQIIQECIMSSIRDSIPFELIVRSYLDNTQETFDEIKEDNIPINPPSNEITTYGIQKEKPIGLTSKEQEDLHSIIKQKVSQDTTKYNDDSKNTKSSIVSVEIKPNKVPSLEDIVPYPDISSNIPKINVDEYNNNSNDSIFPIIPSKKIVEDTENTPIFDHSYISHNLNIYNDIDNSPPDAIPLLDCVDL